MDALLLFCLLGGLQIVVVLDAEGRGAHDTKGSDPLYLCGRNGFVRFSTSLIMVMIMRHWIISTVMAVMALGVLASCATAEERAARAAEQTKKVTAALNDRHYVIAIDRMIPMRGSSKNVSYGYSVEVRNDSLISYLPYFGQAYNYFGQAYNVPYGGGKGLNFSAPISSYQEFQKKSDRRSIEIGLTNEEDTYVYLIDVFDNGSASVHVTARQRESISYSGNMEFKK